MIVCTILYSRILTATSFEQKEQADTRTPGPLLVPTPRDLFLLLQYSKASWFRMKASVLYAATHFSTFCNTRYSQLALKEEQPHIKGCWMFLHSEDR